MWGDGGLSETTFNDEAFTGVNERSAGSASFVRFIRDVEAR